MEIIQYHGLYQSTKVIPSDTISESWYSHVLLFELDYLKSGTFALKNMKTSHMHTHTSTQACAEVCSNPVSVLVYDPGVMSKPLAGYRLCAGVVRGDQRMSSDIP